MPTLSPAAELIVAAGLLEATGELEAPLTLEAATARLRQLLSPTALWWSGPMAPDDVEVSAQRRLGAPPRWRAPREHLLASRADLLRDAWRAALPPADAGWGTPVLRLEVDRVEDAERLAALVGAGPYLIVPSVAARHDASFAWRWPMRIGVAAGPLGTRWRDALRQSPFASLYEVSVVDATTDAPLDIVFVDAAVPGAAFEATCVVMLGEDASPADRLRQGLAEQPQAAIVIGAASSDPDWFHHAIREMAHDQPIDVALRIASHASLIAGDVDLLPLTAVRQWSLELAQQLHGHSGDDDGDAASAEDRLRAIALQERFDSEHQGANRSAAEVRSLEGAGYDTVLRIRRHLSGALPDTAPAETPLPPPPAPAPATGAEPAARDTPQAPPPRRLMADAWLKGKLRRKALLPEREHELRVRIGIPAGNDTAAQVAFPDHDLPADASVELMVDVTSEALGLRERRPIVLSTADRAAPSTIALVRFRTPGEGSVVDLKLLVTHRERPLQEAHYVAPVRARAVAGDAPTLTAVALSSAPEPRADATPAQLSLEVNGANLQRSGTRDAVNLPQIQDLLDGIEQRASRVLASDDAPASLDDPAAVALLVQLARLGAKLKAYLDPLRIDDAGTVSLLVDATTAILPLELAYEAPAPAAGATLCEHRVGGRMAGRPEACADAGRQVVCPYAFWGQRRVIARTLRLRRAPAARAAPVPLDLRPVLYAAVKRADADAPANRKPSQLLEKALKGIVGASGLARVDDWDDWKAQVRTRNPQLLVLLGHTENVDGETGLEIGKGAWLYDPDIDAGYLRDAASPPPLVVLLACSTGVPRNVFGGLPAAFAGNGAAAVVATLTKLTGPHGAQAAGAVVQALFDGASGHDRLGAAMTAARRRLVDDGLLVGLLLVSHGEIDLPLAH